MSALYCFEAEFSGSPSGIQIIAGSSDLTLRRIEFGQSAGLAYDKGKLVARLFGGPTTFSPDAGSSLVSGPGICVSDGSLSSAMFNVGPGQLAGTASENWTIASWSFDPNLSTVSFDFDESIGFAVSPGVQLNLSTWLSDVGSFSAGTVYGPPITVNVWFREG